MKKIYLFCSAGMSTSLLANKMDKVAKNHNIPVVVKAYPVSGIDDIIKSENPDCILLGPQVGYMLGEVIEKYKKPGITVTSIEKGAYGKMNGEEVLKSTLAAMKNENQ